MRPIAKELGQLVSDNNSLRSELERLRESSTQSVATIRDDLVSLQKDNHVLQSENSQLRESVQLLEDERYVIEGYLSPLVFHAALEMAVEERLTQRYNIQSESHLRLQAILTSIASNTLQILLEGHSIKPPPSHIDPRRILAGKLDLLLKTTYMPEGSTHKTLILETLSALLNFLYSPLATAETLQYWPPSRHSRVHGRHVLAAFVGEPESSSDEVRFANQQVEETLTELPWAVQNRPYYAKLSRAFDRIRLALRVNGVDMNLEAYEEARKIVRYAMTKLDEDGFYARPSDPSDFQ